MRRYQTIFFFLFSFFLFFFSSYSKKQRAVAFAQKPFRSDACSVVEQSEFGLVVSSSSCEWFFRTCGVIALAITPCKVESGPFSSFSTLPSPQQIQQRFLAAGEAVICNADEWNRVSAVHQDVRLDFLVFYPTPNFAQVCFGQALPYFVYGTLRFGYKNHDRHLRTHGRRIGGLVKTRDKMALYCGLYPYLVESPPNGVTPMHVVGELYEVTDKNALARLDQLEEGYRKDLIVVIDEEGKHVTAFAYFGETVGFDKMSNIKHVASGDLTNDYPFSHWE